MHFDATPSSNEKMSKLVQKYNHKKNKKSEDDTNKNGHKNL